MIRRLTLFLLTCLVASQLVFEPPAAAQEQDGTTASTHFEFYDDPADFSFAIVGDRTGGLRPGVFGAAVQKLNLLKPTFVISVGDLIDGTDNSELASRELLESQWGEFRGLVDQLDMPFFFVGGNHDLAGSLLETVWREQFGSPYYSFRYQDVLFVALNSEDRPAGGIEDPAGPPGLEMTPFGHIGEAQFAWLQETIDANEDVRWTMMFLHRPMWLYGDDSNWAEIEEILGTRPRTVFGGHHHTRYSRSNVSGNWYYELATTGGGSDLTGPGVGGFDHIAWITLTEEGPIVANVMLDGIFGNDPVAEALREVPAPTTN